MSKATKRQMLEREDDIQAQMRSGQDLADFAQELASKHDCSKLSIERQYHVILNAMIEVQKENREELKITLMLRNDVIFRKAVKDGKDYNPKLALDSLNLQAKIGGLYQPEKAEKAKEQVQPVFNFQERDNSIPLAVVPGEDDDEAGNQ